jgi:hypothetical protein
MAGEIPEVREQRLDALGTETARGQRERELSEGVSRDE